MVLSNSQTDSNSHYENTRNSHSGNGYAEHEEPHSEALTAALYYFDHGCFVVPCCTMTEQGACTFPHTHTTEKSIGKVPILGIGWQHTRLTREEIIEWWTKYPTANVGVLLEPSELMVIDLDSDEATEEASRKGLPPGPGVRAGRGDHHYFRNPKKIIGLTTHRGESGNIDVLSKGIVVGFGSIHRSGKRYALLTSWEEWPLEDPPLWAETLLLERLKEQASTEVPLDDLPPIDLDELGLSPWLYAVILHGQSPHSEPYPSRSEAVWAVLCALVDAGYDTATIASILLDPRFKISEKPREQGARWVMGEIGRARAKTASAGDGPGAAHASASTDGTTPTGAFHLTDTGLAERFHQQHGAIVRWVGPWDKWFVYDTTRWEMDATQSMRKLAKATVRQLYGEAKAIETDDKERQRIGKFALSSESEKARRAMLELAKSEGDIAVLPTLFDTDPWLLNCLNGTVDLRTGALRKHRAEDYITKRVPINYYEKATCPTWDRFIATVMNRDGEVMDFLWKAIGYSLTGDVREQCYFLLYGEGANGKSTLLHILQAVVGEYSQTVGFSTLLHQDKDRITNDVADLAGVRLAVASEVDEGRRFSLTRMNGLTGGDKMRARHLFSEDFEYTPQLKMWLACNHKPVITDISHATWRRVRLIPFLQKFEGDSCDPTIETKLRDELPGILAWTVRGCLAWQQEGLSPPAAVKAATENYRNESDLIGAFLDECCEIDPKATVLTASLYEAYANWCKKSGEGEPKTKKAFGLLLQRRGFEAGQGSRGSRLWKGLALKFTE